MKVVIVDAPSHLIEERRKRGLDRHDEMWEGVYHMVPPPSEEHQDIVDTLFGMFFAYVAKHGLGRLRSMKGVRDLSSPEQNFRVPEWIFLRSGREHLLVAKSSYVDEGPDLVLEVRSPGDETLDKIPFYEKMRVGELLLIDRDTRSVKLHRLAGDGFRTISPGPDGWLTSEALRAGFASGTRSGKAVLRVRLDLDGTEQAV